MIFHPSTKRMNHHLDGLLSGGKARRFQAHLAKCEACSRKVQILKNAGHLCRAPKARLGSISDTVMAVVGQVDNLPEASEAPVVGEIAETSGTVLVRTASDARAVEIFPGCVVRLGDHIEPVDDAAALIEWDDGGSLRIEKPTVLTEEMIAATTGVSHAHTGRTIMKTKRRKIFQYTWMTTATVVVVGVVAMLAFPDLLSRQLGRLGLMKSEQAEGYGTFKIALGHEEAAIGEGSDRSPAPGAKYSYEAPQRIDEAGVGSSGHGGPLIAPLNTFSDPSLAEHLLTQRARQRGKPTETTVTRWERYRYAEKDVEWDLPDYFWDDVSITRRGDSPMVAPIISAVPDIIVSNSAIFDQPDNNLFIFPDAIDLDEYVKDGEKKQTALLRWSFIQSSSPVEINGIGGQTGADPFLLSPAPAEMFKEAKEHSGKLVAMSVDGKKAKGEKDGSVRITDGQTGNELVKLEGDKSEIVSLAWSKNGKQLATASRDFSVRVWDVEAGRPVETLKHLREVRSVAFSPDGRRLASLGKNDAVAYWDTDTGSLIGVAERPRTNAEAYDEIVENPFVAVPEQPLSTFAIDVDTASYSNIRRFLNQNQRPPRNAVRIEEMINYFSYEYPEPTGDDPFSVSLEIADCPWNPAHRLVNVGLKGDAVEREERPPCNLVFLLDVSGSMSPANKLPLVKQAMKMLVENLEDRDRVAIVVYAGASGLVLDSTLCGNKNAILEALDNLKSGGSTNGGEGIVLAYKIALDNFIDDGVNRVILCTDGDFNVGVTDRDQLIKLIEEEATMGTFLTVLGFGMGNLKDATLEQLADKGNGNYGYIDTIAEAQKTLVEQLAGTLVTIAKDVKIQIEFNPQQVAGYRLIGYENRMLRARDFNDDTKDAGEIGASHRVTALYEVVPAGQALPAPPAREFVSTGKQPVATPADEEATDPPDEPEEDEGDVDPLRYQEFGGQPTAEAQSGEMLTAKLRYKEPDGHKSKLIAFPVKDPGIGLNQATEDFRFAAAVASFGMILRDSAYKGNATLDSVLNLATAGKADDRWGYRAEFIELVNKAKAVLAK